MSTTTSPKPSRSPPARLFSGQCNRGARSRSPKSSSQDCCSWRTKIIARHGVCFLSLGWTPNRMLQTPRSNTSSTNFELADLQLPRDETCWWNLIITMGWLWWASSFRCKNLKAAHSWILHNLWTALHRHRHCQSQVPYNPHHHHLQVAPEPHLRPQGPHDWNVIMYLSMGTNLGGFHPGMMERFIYRRFIRDWLIVSSHAQECHVRIGIGNDAHLLYSSQFWVCPFENYNVSCSITLAAPISHTVWYK